MPIEIRVPRLGWTMEEGAFLGWLKHNGDRVEAGEPLFTLEGDKVTQEIEATDGGVLHMPATGPPPRPPVRVGGGVGSLPTEKVPAPSQPTPPPDTASAAPTPTLSPSTESLA